MKTYCVSCKKCTADENSSVRKTILNRLMILSNCAVCGKKKLTFSKNKIINKFLLTGDKFIPELHLRQPGLTYSACRTFTKHREKFQKFRKKVI